MNVTITIVLPSKGGFEVILGGLEESAPNLRVLAGILHQAANGLLEVAVRKELTDLQETANHREGKQSDDSTPGRMLESAEVSEAELPAQALKKGASEP